MDVSVRHFKLLSALLTLLIGCQSTDPSIELLESELRRMEDQLYAMDRQLDQTCMQLSSARNSNRALQREVKELRIGGGKPSAATPSSAAPSTEQDLAPPRVNVPSVDDFDSDKLEVPRIDLGPDTVPQSILPPKDTTPPVVEEDLDNYTQDGDVDIRVTRIVLNSRLTGGYNFDGQPGDDGLLLVVEPQNAAGQYVPLPGDLEIEVLDPQKSGPDARIARWEFDSSETVVTMRKSLLGRGMHLQLPWPGDRPSSENLRLNVHYKPPTGEKLSAKRLFRIDLVATQTEPHSANGRLPDQFVPNRPPRVSQLLPEQMFTMPTAPLSERIPWRASAPESFRGIPQTAIRPEDLRATRTPRPRWQPYR
jgi:hypothetical protein